jgi:type IV secretory pathway VirB2 component (pilin)
MARRSKSRLFLAFTTAACGIWAAAPASAATGGTSLPWDSGLQAISSNVSGPMAYAVTLTCTVLAGFYWMGSQNATEGGKVVAKIALGGALAMLAGQFLVSFGLAGAML